jgi:hypothetical protein
VNCKSTGYAACCKCRPRAHAPVVEYVARDGGLRGLRLQRTRTRSRETGECSRWLHEDCGWSERRVLGRRVQRVARLTHLEEHG